MPSIIQINTVINSGSTGHIAEELGNIVIENGWDSYIAYGRNTRHSNSKAIKIGSKIGVYFHVFITRFFDNHGFGSYLSTKKLIKKIEVIKPSLIHLHNIHGYYINISLLFKYLKKKEIPVIWTLHDCWAFTGHCSHYTAVNCNKWKNGCYECLQSRQYPKSYIDNSKFNYQRKKELFNGLQNLTIVVPSVWLAEQVKNSFLGKYPLKVINNGIDLNVFSPNKIDNQFIVLGVASTWNDRKGFNDFIKLSKLLPEKYKIVMVGLSDRQINDLPKSIQGIKRTESVESLAELYSMASVFFNPTYEDTFPTTNIEALACGTPVITYKTGGSPEIIDDRTGIIVEPGDIDSVAKYILRLEVKNSVNYFCTNRAKKFYDKKTCFQKYFNLYNDLI